MPVPKMCYLPNWQERERRCADVQISDMQISDVQIKNKGAKLFVSRLLQYYFVPAGFGGTGAGLFKAKRLAITVN